MMSRSFVVACLGFFLIPLTSIHGEIIINEIMYHPPGDFPGEVQDQEDPAEEFIELYNRGITNVALDGWTISRGVTYAFPAGLVMMPGDYLVVAADVAAFTARYGAIDNLVGGWIGQLSNSGEDIEIEDAEGNRVDLVGYADSGDWAIRQVGPLGENNNIRNWIWYAEHDGLGNTLERINPAVDINNGQNWGSSEALNGTPGLPNSSTSSNIAPIIRNVGHFPSIPHSTDPVTISARVTDEVPLGATATLFYGNASGGGETTFSSTPMFDDGLHEDGAANDGVFGVILPAMAHGTVIDFYVQAQDGQGNIRTWPAAARQSEFPDDNTFAQTANALYQVDDTEYLGGQPLHKLIFTEQERARLAANNIRQVNAQMNATFITVDGTGTKVRYNAGVRIRGAGSRNAQVPNYRVNLPSDRPWNGVTSLNHNAQYGHSQVAGSALALKSGLHMANARAVQVRVNGANLAGNGENNGFGSYVLVEVVNGDWAQNHFPLDPNGNAYSARRPNTSLQYLGENFINYLNNGYGKNSNNGENDWSDLINLTFVLDNAADETYVEEVGAVANLAEWMRYFAFFSMSGSLETSLGTGETAGDDYNMYRGLVDPRFLLIPHDLDTIMAQGDTAPQPNLTIWIAADGIPGDGQANGNPRIRRMMRHNDIVPMFFAELKRMSETTFSEPELRPLLENLLGDYVPQANLEEMINFANQRIESVLGQIPLTFSANTALPVVNGYPMTTAPNVNFTGQADGIRTRSILVNGQTATWVAWQGTWSVNAVPVRPGINRILVQFLDANDNEIHRLVTEVWRDDGSVVTVSSGITANTTWTAAGGPYLIPSTINVSGATLTIEAGTTVYLGNNADINVAATGRILADGTAMAPIVFTRQPGAATSWGGINVSGNASSPETRIAHAHFNFNNDTAVHATDATVFLDHLTFANTDVTYVEVDRSSFVIQDCVFPTSTSPFELVHGTGGVKAGGRAIFLRNFFGFTQGYNDSVDFTGGNRPGPIVQFFDNVFLGSDDDILDLDSTDAWIQGNIFLHTHRNGSPDSASAVSGGADNADTSEITIVGNLFYDVDQVANAKQGNFYTIINNTIVRQTIEGSEDLEGGVIVMADEGTVEGEGMWLEANIIVDAEELVRAQTDSIVTFTNNIMALEWEGPGGDNRDIDPQLNYIPDFSETTNFTSYAEAQVLWDWFALRPGSPARGAGPNGVDLGGDIPFGVSLSGQPVGATRQTNVTITVGFNRSGGGIPGTPAGFPEGSGFTHYRWRLNGMGSWSAETPIDTPITLTGLTDGEYFIEVSGRLDSGLYQDDPAFGSKAAPTISEPWQVVSFLSRLVINEVFARNQTAYLLNNTYPDVVEIYNDSSLPRDLSGMGVTDDVTNKFKFVFPPGTILDAGEYLVLQADDELTPGFHLGFGLDGEGDYVYLYSVAGTELDSVRYGVQIADLSISRLPDGGWGLSYPTLGEPNIAHPVNPGDRLVLNEWLPIGGSSFPDDFIEVFNPDPVPASLGGMYLTDEQNGWPDQHEITPLSFIPPRGHLAFLAVGNTGRNALRLNFSLQGEQGRIALLNHDLEVVDCINYGPQSPDVSEGRRPDGSDLIVFFGAATQSQPTPGGPNPSSGISVNVSNIVLNLFPMETDWRYENTGTDLGTEWRVNDYDDGFWLSGPALLGVENSGLPAPGLQTIFTGYDNLQPTYYFRKEFVVDQDVTGFALRATTVIDDGAVLYLNGSEVLRVRMPAGTITYDTLGLQPTVNNASAEFFEIPSNALIQGTNVLAAEVHQAGAPSSDIVWGMSLEAVRSVTNIVAVAGVINEIMANNASYTNRDGSISDYIEIYNPLNITIDMSGLSLSDDISQPRRWVFPENSVMPPNSYLVVKADSSLPPSLTYGNNMNTGFGLDANGESVFLFDRPARGGSLLDSIQFGLQTTDLPVGRYPSGSPNWTLTLATPGSVNLLANLAPPNNLKINEWMADPDGGDDWFEIFNPNNQPVALGGLYLTDDLTDRTKHQIVPLSFIGAVTNGFARFFADGNPENGADHVDFSLRAAGESIAIARNNGALIDSVSFGQQIEGVSEGRLPDGAEAVVAFPDSPTPRASNYLPLNQIVVNEALTHSDPPLEDAIELYNPTAASISIGGWYLSDSPTFLRKFRIPDGTVVPAEGTVVFYEYQFNRPGFSESFALSSANGDQIILSESDPVGNLSGYRHNTDFGPSANGVTFGRHPTSVGFDFTAMDQRTLGVDNPTTTQEFREGMGLPNSDPKVGPIVITEFMYHPPDIGGTNDNSVTEYIEIYNTSAEEVALYDPLATTNTWRIRDAVDYEFPANTVMPGQSYLIVVSFDPATNTAALAEFESTYSLPANATLLGPYRGKLDNSGEDIELKKPDPPQLDGSVPYVLVDWIDYKDSDPWPSAADSGTNLVSLHRTAPLNYGNDPVHWVAGAPTPGGPAGAVVATPPSFTLQPVGDSLTPGGSASFTVAVSGASPISLQWRFNGFDIPGATNASLSLANVQIEDGGLYDVRAANLAGAALSAPAKLVLEGMPVIIQQPVPKIAAPGGRTFFSVGVEGTLPMTFQWRFDAGSGPSDIADATNQTFVITMAELADVGDYSVVVENLFGSATSEAASLQLADPPEIVEQPEDTAVLVGRTASFRVSATGNVPFGYQWFHNGVALEGANGSIFNLANAQLADAGFYTVRVTNLVGVALSDPAELTVVVPPMVSITATDPSAVEGSDPGQFTLSRTGSTALPLDVVFTIGGTAMNGTDYQTISIPATFPVGASTLNIPLITINDSEKEFAETVRLTVTTTEEYNAVAPVSATVVIVDDDNISPEVAVTSPPDGLVLPFTPTNILLTVQATDADGTIAKVEYFNHGTEKLAELTGPSFTYNWINPTMGTNVITAVATDDLGRATTSAPITFFVNFPPQIQITRPGTGTAFNPGTNILITAESFDIDGTVEQVEIYSNDELLGSFTAPPYEVTLESPPLGNYSLTARARDNLGMVTESPVVNIRVRIPSTEFADFFIDRGELTGFVNIITSDNTTATLEVGEPAAFHTGTRTMWISWRAPAAGQTVIQTLGSSFDTVVSVYTNAPPDIQTITNLVLVTQNDDWQGLQSTVLFDAVAGIDYHFRVEGYGIEDAGFIQFVQVLQTPAPHVIFQPEDELILQGGTATFQAAVSALENFNSQWYRNGAPIQGANATSLTITNAQPSDLGEYYLIVANAFGSDTSQVARLEFGFIPTFVRNIAPQSVVAGDTAYFEVEMTGTPPFGYQWRLFPSGSIVEPFGVGTSTLVIPNARVGGIYYVQVTNSLSLAPSQSSFARLTILADSDGDHVPDTWESDNGFDPQDASDGPMDADGDGASNHDEYRAGTDPRDPDSYLKIDSIAVSSGVISMTFEALSGKSYSIMYQNQLGPPESQKLMDIESSTTTRTETVTDASAPPDGMRFYQLVTPKMR